MKILRFQGSWAPRGEQSLPNSISEAERENKLCRVEREKKNIASSSRWGSKNCFTGNLRWCQGCKPLICSPNYPTQSHFGPGIESEKKLQNARFVILSFRAHTQTIKNRLRTQQTKSQTIRSWVDSELRAVSTSISKHLSLINIARVDNEADSWAIGENVRRPSEMDTKITFQKTSCYFCSEWLDDQTIKVE